MNLERILPAVGWLRRYRRTDLGGDLTAGVIVAVMLVPQGMAYAMLAGLPPVVGLYASTLPILAYALFGSSKQLAVGPVALVSLLTLSGVSQLAETGSGTFLAYAALLALMVGAIQLALGLARVGFVFNFLSHAVVSGFTSAAALIIGLSQLKHLLGVELERSESVFLLLWEALRRVGEIEWITLLIGAGSIALLLLGKRLAKRFPMPLLVVALATAVVAFFGLEARGVAIVGTVPGGLPGFAFPRPGGDLLGALGALVPTALTIAFVSFMESLAVARAIAARRGYEVSADRELVGLGVANLAGGLFSAYPVTGGFSRSAVNDQAGARTPLAGVVTALLVALTLLFFTPLFHDLPRAVLAAIIMVAVAGLIDVREAVRLFRVKPADGWTLLVTFVATLTLGIEIGILLGVAFSLLVFVVRSSRPHTAELGRLDGHVFRNVERYPEVHRFRKALLVRPDATLYFANGAFLDDWLERRVNRRLSQGAGLDVVILDFSGVNDIDAEALGRLEARLAEDVRGVALHIAGMKGPVRDVAERAGWYDRWPERIAHLSLERAVDTLGLEPDDTPPTPLSANDPTDEENATSRLEPV